MTRHTLLIWSLLFLLGVLDTVWLSMRGMSVVPVALALIFLPTFAMLALVWFYIGVRPDPRLAALAHMTAATLAFMSATCILSYLAITLRRPLIDPRLVAADRAIGLDWLAMYAWIAARPFLHTSMKLIYMTLIPQIIVVQIVLNFRGQITRAWESFWLFVLACLAAVVMSGIWPAAGAFSYYHVEANEPYLREFAALYDGTLKIIGRKGGMQGLVTFPSLHMALALLFPYAMRGVPILFPVFVAVDVLVIATTPAIGGHHFADLWGGTAVALAAIWIVRGYFSEKRLAEFVDYRSGRHSGGKKNAGRIDDSSRAMSDRTS